MNQRTRQSRRQMTAGVPLLLSVIACAILPKTVMAVDDWDVSGEHGQIIVDGVLSEGSCQLDMTSAFQQVQLRPISRQHLQHPGDQEQPIAFQIKLRDCVCSGGNEYDRYTGNNTWDASQPVATISFTGVTDAMMPVLLKASGVSGLGLRLTDPLGRTIQPGERGEPLMLMPGDNVLTYTVTPVRTPAPLTTGSFRAVTNFEVSYD